MRGAAVQVCQPTEFSLSPNYADGRYTWCTAGFARVREIGSLLFERQAGIEFKICDLTPAEGTACAPRDAEHGFDRARETRSVLGDVAPGDH